jgi:hypothetical protein
MIRAFIVRRWTRIFWPYLRSTGTSTQCLKCGDRSAHSVWFILALLKLRVQVWSLNNVICSTLRASLKRPTSAWSLPASVAC